MRSLISETISKKLDEVVGMCFLGNRIADRGVSLLAINFAMNHSMEIIHQSVAHLFPKLADVVSEYKDARNVSTIYPLTPEDASVYNSPTEFFEKILEYMTELEATCYDAYRLAEEEGDLTTSAFLHKFIRMLIPVTSQCLLFVDKCEAYKGDWMQFDHDIKDFLILKKSPAITRLLEE